MVSLLQKLRWPKEDCWELGRGRFSWGVKGQNSKLCEFLKGLLRVKTKIWRMEWPVGRLTQVLPGRDSNVRVVMVKTVSGGLVRPVQQVYPWRYAFVCLVGQQQYGQHFHNALYTHVSGIAASKASLCYNIREDRKLCPLYNQLSWFFTLILSKGKTQRVGEP
jgi:hypothetical protein